MLESKTGRDTQEILAGLEKLFEKYLDKDEIAKEKTPLDQFFGTYLRSMKDEDEARPKDWDGNTGSILTFVRMTSAQCLRITQQSAYRPVYLLRPSRRS